MCLMIVQVRHIHELDCFLKEENDALSISAYSTYTTAAIYELHQAEGETLDITRGCRDVDHATEVAVIDTAE